ncbi:hypothetical protein QBC35DRAFT_385878 [Podospora australis]|uniref:Uncharacterized protein n=1 Tax=Podospora australis TaxID=1536484 RepID=A0AAN7AFT0_9PEZI|nr:hypothetical protein QBC35DRAFT_385878 [Podospora australis]
MLASPSFVESRSYHSATHQQSWLGPLVLAALTSMTVASVIGTSLSAVVFGSTHDLKNPGYGIAQSFVLFSSIFSFLYVLLHFLASRKGNALYLNFDPPIPSFKHQLHAWAIVVIRISVTFWATAIIAVAVGIHHGGGGHNTVRLDVSIFASTVGFVFGSVILCVVQFCTRPFDLPGVYPSETDDEFGSEGIFEDKPGGFAGGASSGSSSDDRTIRVKIGHRPKMPSKSTSNLSGSSSSSQTRAGKMTRVRRYILEAPTPMAAKPPDLPASDPEQAEITHRISPVEESLVPRVSASESYFTAGPVTLAKQQLQGRQRRGSARPVSPATVIYVGDNVGNSSTARLQRRDMNMTPATLATVTPAVMPAMPPSPPPSQPPPPPPPPPPKMYSVPGAWTLHPPGDGEPAFI